MALLALAGTKAGAQIGTGGLPLSMQAGRPSDNVPVTSGILPDWDNGMKKWESQSSAKPYLVALTTPIEVAFPNSGIMYTAENGARVWRSKINVDGAKALGLYYDNFQLPEGVKLYLSNANGKQILGAYTALNNDPSSFKFATEAVQGGVINLELDIEPAVDISGIKLHIDKAAVYNRGIEYLQTYTGSDLQTIDAVDTALTGRSSVCMINAICPEGNNYAVQRNAAFQWLIQVGQGVGACSATMINSLGNTTSNCKQYFLIASHCDGSNATTNSAFNQVLLRYNFQHATCTPTGGNIPNTTRTLTGANFIARSVIPSNPQDIKGDFLLMEARSAIPESWNVNLAGWNNAANIPLTQTSPKKFIGFHHPGGDAKKVSSSQQIQTYSLGAASTHWATVLAAGLAAEGSSGSALFDGDGRIIGVASVAAVGQGVSASCGVDALGNNVAGTTSNTVLYSKLAYDWDYNVDGSASNRKLKPWLDPANTGATTIDAVKSTCAPLSGGGTAITNENKLDEGIAVFPNPSGTGHVTLKLNLGAASDIYMDLFDISGKKINSYSLKKVSSGSFALDLSSYANGMYLLQLTDGYHTTSKKIMLAR